MMLNIVLTAFMSITLLYHLALILTRLGRGSEGFEGLFADIISFFWRIFVIITCIYILMSYWNIDITGHH